MAEYLRTRNLSDAEFAAIIGVSEHGVKKWRYAERIPGKAEMAKIVAATDGMVTPNDFYGVAADRNEAGEAA